MCDCYCFISNQDVPSLFSFFDNDKTAVVDLIGYLLFNVIIWGGLSVLLVFFFLFLTTCFFHYFLNSLDIVSVPNTTCLLYCFFLVHYFDISE